jgi:hypothetical protein
MSKQICSCGGERTRSWRPFGWLPFCRQCFAKLPAELRTAIERSDRTDEAIAQAEEWLAIDRARQAAKLAALVVTKE